MMEIWNKLATPPEWALKPIQAGRLKGKTDISPQWRYHAVTELFGPCGIGWKYEKVQHWTEPGLDGQLMCFADINFYIKHEGQWSEPIPATGGDFLIKKESNGLHHNDEAYAMAITDALGKAMKMIGVAANVYYQAPKQTKYDTENTPVSAPQPLQQEKEYITDAQQGTLVKLAKEYGMTNTDMKDMLLFKFRVNGSKNLTKKQAGLLIAKFGEIIEEWRSSQEVAATETEGS